MMGLSGLVQAETLPGLLALGFLLRLLNVKWKCTRWGVLGNDFPDDVLLGAWCS